MLYRAHKEAPETKISTHLVELLKSDDGYWLITGLPNYEDTNDLDTDWIAADKSLDEYFTSLNINDSPEESELLKKPD